MEPIDQKSSQKLGGIFILALALLAVSTFCRLLSYPTITSDYTYFLAKWFEVLQSHAGLTAFLYPFSDYSPLYLYFIKILTYIPVYNLWSIKTLSFGFDIALGMIIAKLLAGTTTRSKEILFFCFAIMLSIPTIVINSSLWGQSDAAYAACVLASVYYITKEKPRHAAILFALGLSFKLQAIFFLPILVGLLVSRKSVKELFWIPIVYAITTIPALIGGAPFASTLFIYAHQSTEYTSLNVSSPSVFAFIEKISLTPSQIQIFFWLGITISGIVALTAAYAALRIQRRADVLVMLSLWSVLLVPYFLPRMHERYFFLADVFSVVLALYRPRFFIVPILVVGGSLLSYMPYLSGQVSYLSSIHVDLRVPSAMLFIAAVITTFLLFKLAKQTESAVR